MRIDALRRSTTRALTRRCARLGFRLRVGFEDERQRGVAMDERGGRAVRLAYFAFAKVLVSIQVSAEFALGVVEMDDGEVL